MIRVDGARVVIATDDGDTEMVFLAAADAEAFAARAGGATSRAALEAVCHTPSAEPVQPPTPPPAAVEDVALVAIPQATPAQPPPATVTATWKAATRRLTATLRPTADTTVFRFIDGSPASTPSFTLTAGTDSTRSWTMAPGQTLTLRWGAATGPILFETKIPGA